jgi:hypothetical protein
VAAAAAVVVVGLGRVVGEPAADMAGFVDLACVLEKMIRKVVGWYSVLFDQAACSPSRMCCAREMRTLKPLLADEKATLNDSGRLWMVEHFRLTANIRSACEICYRRDIVNEARSPKQFEKDASGDRVLARCMTGKSCSIDAL